MGMNKRVQEHLAIGVVWIGHSLDPEDELHREIIDEKIIYKQEEATEDAESEFSDYEPKSFMYPRFELTSEGEPICLNEHLCEISAIKRIHVLLLDDEQQDLC